MSQSQDLTIQFEENVQQWEYIAPVVPQEHLGPALERIGLDGWEFVQGFPCQVAIGGGGHSPSGLITPQSSERPQATGGLMLIFKRPKAPMAGVNSSGLAASQN